MTQPSRIFFDTHPIMGPNPVQIQAAAQLAAIQGGTRASLAPAMPASAPLDVYYAPPPALTLRGITNGQSESRWSALACVALLGAGGAFYLKHHGAIEDSAAVAMASGPLLVPGLLDRLNRWLRGLQDRFFEITLDAIWRMRGVDPMTREFWRLGKISGIEEAFEEILHGTSDNLIGQRFKHLATEERLIRAERLLRCFSRNRYQNKHIAIFALHHLTHNLVSWLTVDERHALISHFTENGIVASFPESLVQEMTQKPSDPE